MCQRRELILLTSTASCNWDLEILTQERKYAQGCLLQGSRNLDKSPTRAALMRGSCRGWRKTGMKRKKNIHGVEDAFGGQVHTS